MTLLDLARLLVRHARWLLLLPLVAAATVALLTRDQPQTYGAHATLYTGLVSGYTVESSRQDRVDYRVVNSAFDNLIGTIEARATAEAVALRLLADHLTTAEDVPRGGADVRALLAEALPAALRHRLAAPTPEATLDRLRAAKDAPGPLHDLIFEGTSAFSLAGLQASLEAHRVGSSDLLEVRYTATDAVVCKRTLDHLLDVFLASYGDLKLSEAASVVAFFEEETDAAEARLREAVGRLRDFGVEHEIIHYTEQTEAIAQQREKVAHELEQERMRLAAAESTFAELTTKLEADQDRLARAEDLLATRDRLAAATARAALQGADAAPDSLRLHLSEQLRAHYRTTRSADGLSRPDLAEAWLEQGLAVRSTRARVAVLERHAGSFAARYRTLAPLGSKLAGIEREADIAERAYLELLHSLNLARMRQQNMRLASDLRVVDPPFVPDRPQPSKRMLLVVAAALAVGLVVTGGVVARELLDQTLRVPARAAETTGLALAGAQPVATATGAPAFLPDVMRALDVGLGRRVLAHLPPDAYASVSDASDADGHNALDGHDADAPALVPVVSVQAGEGKTFVARRLAAHLARTGLAVGLLVPETDGEDIAAAAESPEGVTVRRYAVTDALPLARRLADLAADAPAAFAGCACVLVEWPALLGHAAPRRLLRRAALPLVVVRADRAWAAADRRAAADLAAACPVPPELVLNGVPLDRLDDLVGEVPRPRGRLRRLAKRLARLAFSRPSLPSPSSTPS